MAVTFIESPVTAWVQTVSEENTAKITSIIEQLVQCCPAAPKVKGIPQIGKVRFLQHDTDTCKRGKELTEDKLTHFKPL